MKRKWKRVVSGMLTAVTLMSTAIQPIAVSAAEPEKTKPPLYDEVKEFLDTDEVVTAHDYEMEVGHSFDPVTDFSGIEIPDNQKVKVSFEEAVNEQGETFDSSHADTYQAVYYVEPQRTEHPTYQVSRKLIVREPGTEAQTAETHSSEDGGQDSSGTEEAQSEDGESEPQSEVTVETVAETEKEKSKKFLGEKALDEALEEAETQNTYDEESGLTLGMVWNQVIEGDVDIFAMEEGETITFTAYNHQRAMSRATDVDVTAGSWYYYADYGLGTYLTCPYTVKFGNVTATAYCVQPSKPGPGDGKYSITKLSDGKILAKVCYYGTKASGENGFFAEKHPDFSTGKKFIITHIAASYANGSSDAFSGTNETGKALAMELYNYCVNQPDIPSVNMSFSDEDVTAYVNGNEQRTKEVTFKADTQQTITMKLPDGVKLHNVSTGKTSSAGADVEICGGTVFYLSAPLTQAADVKQSWSSTMKGSIVKDYSAYKITTGAASQDLALVFGEGVDDEKYVSFHVAWVELATVSIHKKDAESGEKLEGAVYGIYSDEACKNLIVKMPPTDKNGASSVTFAKTQETVFLKEISAPAGYVIDSASKNVKLIAFEDVKNEVSDKEQLAELTIYKKGEVLTGASVTEAGVSFQYETRKLKGAKYTVSAGADIYSPTGKLLHKKGAVIAENLTTGDAGSAILSNLHLGTYVVTEAAAPENFVNTKESKTVVLSYAGQNVETVFSDMTFTNDRQKAEVSVVKKDKDTENPLDGGIFGLYAGSDITNADGTVVVKKGTLIEKVTTGTDGTAVFKSDLPIGFSYEVKEEKAPEGYLRNGEDIFTFQFSYTNDSEAKVKFSHTFVNERVSAKIVLQKKDKETNQAKPQGDASLEKAVYGLYARTDIVHPDGKTGVIHKAGEQVASLTTDQKGTASIDNLYLGNYFVKEITPPVGYLADDKEYDLVCNYEGDLTAVVERSCVSLEQVKKQPFQIIKAANNGNTDAPLLAGAGFTAYLESSLKKKADGSYNFQSAQPVVIGENGATEIFTDEKGYACSIALPYGTYVVRETTTPHNYKPVDDFIVRITEHHPNTPQVWRVLLDEEFEAKLKIVKQDDETKKPVLAKNTEFKVYDLDHKKYVEQVTTYPTTVTHKSYFTDEKGYLILPQNLKIGHYRIEEVTAPFGYTINENYFEVTVDSNTAYQMDSVSGDVVIEVVYENHPVKGKLLIQKAGEVLDGFKDDFTYKTEKLAGAVFEVYATEDIYTADFQKDEEGKRILEYAAGTLVDTLTTNEKGEAELDNLPLGSYKVVEVQAPEGFVLNEVTQTVTFAYADQNTPVIEQTAMFVNDRQKVEISVVKRDAETKAAVSGAVFGLYAKEDITAHGKVLVKAGTLLGKAESGEDGKAVFTQDVPFGTYFIRELHAPAGYVSSDEELEVTAAYQGQDVKVLELSSDFENQPTKISVKKTDITTGVELEGATLTVLDKDGNVVDTWKSVKGEEHLIERLIVGNTYILREEMAPYGYLKAEEVTFTVEDTAEIQKVEMKDDVPTGLLIINKKGEFLDKITPMDSVGGWIAHLFEYVSGSLKDVTFEVYALDDVKAADGESEDYYKKDELVGTITTDETGYAKLENLPLGKYYVKEKETAEGYVLDGEIREIDLTYRDQDTPVVTFSEDWQNKRQKAEVSVLKKGKGSDRVLEGAVFALYTKEDILGADGSVLMKADTVIEEKATDKEGKLLFSADLPIGYTYYVKETSPAPGFATTAEKQEFTFQYEGAEKESVSYEFTFEDEPTVFEFTKTSLTTGKEVEGAKLQITDESGTVVDEWVSGKEPHIVRELVVGKTYTMTETKPADGYVTAESIVFTVEDTAEVQKVEMKDDVTKVEISKTDIAGKELPGAKLTILNEKGEVVESWTSGKEPHYIEMLPIGKYVLREETAPEGYLVAEDVSFEVQDTAEIQKVQMKDEAKPAENVPEETKKSNAPKTGDNSPLGMLLILLILGAAGAGVSAWNMKRKK